MDQKETNAMVFMVFGLGFFLFVTFIILFVFLHMEKVRVMEMREFGAGSERQHRNRPTIFRRK